MTWLHAHAQVLPLEALLNTPNTGSLRAAITFDDGYATLHDVAHPILQTLGFHPTVFLTSGMLSETQAMPSQVHKGHYPQESFMSWQEVRALLQAGWSVGCHGWQHLDCTRVTENEFKTNLQRCQAAIASRTGSRANMMAFTWGKFTRQALRAACELGMRHSFSCIHGAVKRPLRAHEAIPRIDIRPDLALQDFASIVRGDWDYLGIVQHALHFLRDRHAS
jgi:peptidoglycan/xylan/chitin deacetylase (PgdA/CDA1 family)